MASNVKVGDHVRFLNEVGGGRVTRKEGNTVYVEDEDGFEIPALTSAVVVVAEADDREQGRAYTRAAKAKETKKTPKVMAPGTSWRERVKADQEEPDDEEEEEEEITFTPAPTRNPNPKASQETEQPKPERYVFDADATDDANPHFMLALTQADGGNSGMLDLHVVNDSNYFASYVLIRVGSSDTANVIAQGTIEPNTKEFIDKLNPMQVDGQTWRVQLLMFKKIRTYKPQPVRDVVLKPSGVKMLRSGSFEVNDFFDQKAMLFHVIKDELATKIEQLTDRDLRKASNEGRKLQAPKLSRSCKEKGLLEVDLHIGELIPDTRGLDNKDMLQVQMNHVRTVMEQNVHHHGLKIVFIHGVGAGVLKTELRKFLERNYPKCPYQDASFREYGFGATMVTV